MYHHMDGGSGSGWFWMLPMMLLSIIVLGAVIYAAVRLALMHGRQKPPSEVV